MAQDFARSKISESILKSMFVAGSALTLVACGGGSGGNTAPDLADSSLSFSTLEDTAVSGTVSATDADGDTLGFSIGTSPSNGSLTVNQDGSFTYTPDANFFGEDVATISVSDSIASVTATLSFSVSNVNDLPVITTSSLVVGSNGQTNGVVEATDIDGDALIFAVDTQPQQGTVEINSSTGEFTFTANELATVDDSFIVSVSDGIGAPVTATIALGASYVSNEDKLTYYYASSHSHIAQAEAMILSDGDNDQLQISDAEVAEDAYINIAVGYAQGGFPTLSQQTITEKVLTRQGKAEAYRLSANQLDSLGQTETARAFRSSALAEQNAYVAEIGLDNLSSNDANFYRALIEEYIAADDLESATNLLNVVRIYADALSDLTQERTTAHGRFDVVARNFLASRVEAYASDQSTLNFDAIVLAIDFATHIADTTSFNEVGGNNYFTNRTLTLVETTRSAYAVSLQGSDEQKSVLLDKAKTLLARSIAMYVPADYDDDYSFPVADYADETLRRYPTGIGLLAGPFAALYPDYIATNSTDTVLGNLPLMLVEEEEGSSDRDTKNAYRDHYAYSIVAAAVNGEDITPIINDLTTTFTTTYDDTVLVVEALVEQDDIGFIDKRAAWFLHYAGLDAQARDVIEAAIDTLATDAYFADVGYNVDGLVENQGCSRFVQLFGEFGGENATQTALYGECLNLVSTYFGDDSSASESQAMNAWVNAAVIQKTLGNDDAANAALVTATSAVELNTDIDDLFGGRIYIANTHASLGNLSIAASQFTALANDAMTRVNATSDIEDRVELVDDILGELEEVFEPDDSNAFLHIDYLVLATQKHAGTNDEYAQAMADIRATAKGLLDNLLAATSDFADSEKVDFYEVFIEQYAWLGEFDAANALAVNDIYTSADRETLFATIAETMANRDDFPASAVANVDTDLDGLPNFFLQNASDEDIESSGLAIDNDADNDGITDPSDINPLDQD